MNNFKQHPVNKGFPAVLLLSLVLLFGITAETYGACSLDTGGTYIEAENYTSIVNTGADGYSWELVTNGNINGGKALQAEGSNKNQGPKEPPKNGQQMATYTINVATAGTYYFWFRGSGKSLYFAVDSSTWNTINFNESGGPGGTNGKNYTWTTSGIAITLSAGEHTIQIISNEEYTALDGFYLTMGTETPSDKTVPDSVTSLDPNNCYGTGYLEVSPVSLGPTCYEGYDADSETFTLTNSGEGTVTNVTITAGDTWLAVSPSSITSLAAGDSTTITVTFSSSSLSTGSYSTEIDITATNSENSTTETVTLLVKELSDDTSCGDVPLYAQDIITPAIMVQLDTSGSMATAMPIMADGENPATPDLADIVQEIVDLSGWASGNAMAFVITGTGSRKAYSYDGLSNAAPKLIISYTESSTTEEVESRVSSSEGDVQVEGATLNTTATTLELGGSKPVGLIFEDIAVPVGATIVSAEIEFIIKTGTSTTTNLTVYGINSADPAGLTYNDLSSTDYFTTASVDWSGVESWANTMSRIAIAEDVLAEVFEDESISWGFATWTSKHSSSDNYTNYRIGVHDHDATHHAALQEIVDDGTANGSTPLGPTMLAAINYFDGSREDGYYEETYEEVDCQPKVLVLVTDGLGNVDSALSTVKTRAQALADAGISVVAVGFGLTDASQLNAIAAIAQENGEEDDSDYLYALHETDSDDEAIPYLAQSRADFIEAMQTIVSAVKNQAFKGSSPASATSTDDEDYVLYASFDPSNNWSGDLEMYEYDTSTDSFSTTATWIASEQMPDTADINAYIYDSSETDLVATYLDSSLTGDNYLCKPLGDIINSSPVVLANPSQVYSFNGYKMWKYSSNVYGRTPLVYVNANDGALHAFSFETGEEQWRFYPDSVKTKLNLATTDSTLDMCSSTYCHMYINDGTPVIQDVYDGSDWRTILVSGLGLGGEAFFALDVTYGNDFSHATLPAEYLWEFTNTDDEEIGMATSLPELARVEKYESEDSTWSNTGTSWVTYIGSGKASTETLQASKEAYLFAFRSWDKAMVWRSDDTATEADTYKVKLESDTLEDDIAASPSHVNVVDDDDTFDRIYLGNRYGDMFRVSDIGEGQVPVVDKLYDSANTDHSTPIVAKAGYAYAGDPDYDGIDDVWIYFGTGKYEETADKVSTDQQYLFGLFDEEGAKSSPYELSDLVVMQTEIVYGYVVDTAGEKVDVNGDGTVDADDLRPFRTITCDSAYQDEDGNCTSDGESWLFELTIPSDTASERSFRKPLVYSGIVYFVTFIPNGEMCEGNGSSYIIALDYENGSQSDTPVFDINEDGSYTTADTYIIDASGTTHQVVGLALGDGVASELEISTSGDSAVIYYSMSGSTYSSGSSSDGGTTSSDSDASDDSERSTGLSSNSPNGSGGVSINGDFDKAVMKAWWQQTN